MSSSTPSKNKFSSGVAVQPRCDTPDSRTAAYSLLAELARDCPQNLNSITSKIVAMHHSFDQGRIIINQSTNVSLFIYPHVC